jgi:P2 family phage contractile tail tube protein
MSTPERHTWELREVQQTVENTGELEPTGVKHIVKGLPKKMDGGSLKSHSTSDPNTVASVLYWAEFRNGERMLELDPLNDVCFMNGVDYLEPVRKALGK